MRKSLLIALLFLSALFFNSCAYYSREIAYANFSDLADGSFDTDGYNISGSGWDSNPGQKNALRLLNKDSFLSLNFYINDVPENAFLLVEHASSSSQNCNNGGYSPVTIKINNISVVTNFSPPSHRYTTKKWNVTDILKTGENEISWTGGNLCSSYLLRNWSIFDNGGYYYSTNYDNYYYPRFYYLHRQQQWVNIPHRHYEFMQKRNRENNQYHYYNFMQKRYDFNNRQKHFEHKQKRNDRSNHKKR